MNVTREEFVGLPAQLALGVLWDVAHARLEQVPCPPVPRPPRYDDRFTRKKGFYCWCSEMTLSDLEWWRGKKAESAANGGTYAESDAKWVTKLDKWIEWRRLFPYEPWSGTRGESRATAAPPSREPMLHPWGDRPNNKTNERPASPEDDGRNEESEFDF